MSPPEVWGPAVWTLFHTLAEKINVNAYPLVFPSLFNMIVKICRYLPCPECSSDASNFLAKVKATDLKSKESLKAMLCVFHNTVNAKKRKPIFHYSNIGIYGRYNLIKVINNFISQYQTKGNMKLLTESFQRQFVINDFKNWFRRVFKAFAEVPAVVEEPVINVVEEEPVIHVVEEEPVINEEDEELLAHVVEEEPVINEEDEELLAHVVEEEPVINEEDEEPVINVVEEEPVINVVEEEPVAHLVEEEPVINVVEEEPVAHLVEEEPVINVEEPIDEPQEEESFSVTIEEPAIEDSLSDPIEEPATEESLDSSIHEQSSVTKKSKKNKNKKNKK